MRHGYLVLAIIALVAVSMAGQSPSPKPAPKRAPIAKPAPVPKTPWGVPDLQGTWFVLAAVPLERSAQNAGKEFLSDEEMAAARVSMAEFVIGLVVLIAALVFVLTRRARQKTTNPYIPARTSPPVPSPPAAVEVAAPVGPISGGTKPMSLHLRGTAFRYQRKTPFIEVTISTNCSSMVNGNGRDSSDTRGCGNFRLSVHTPPRKPRSIPVIISLPSRPAPNRRCCTM